MAAAQAPLTQYEMASVAAPRLVHLEPGVATIVLLTFGLVLSLTWLLWVRRRATRPLSAIRRRSLLAARSAFVVLVYLALLQPSCRRAQNDLSIVFALDVSRSMDATFLDHAADWIAQASRHPAVVDGDAVIQVMPFAAQPLPMVLLTSGSRPPLPDRRGDALDLAGRALDPGSTNLEAAMRQALRQLAPGRIPRVVLISDGHETQGRIRTLLPRFQELDVRVFTAPPESGPLAWIESVEIPPTIVAGAPVDLNVLLGHREPTADGADTNEEVDSDGGRELKAFWNGTPLARLSLGPGDLTEAVQRVPVTVRLPEPGPGTLEVRVVTNTESDSAAAPWRQSLVVQPRHTVLYIEGRPQSARFLAGALRNEGLEVVVATAESLPTVPSSLATFDAVVLSDVPPDTLEPAQMDALEIYVRDSGGGLLFAAGDSTYGEEGYSDSALERILPVRFNVEEQRSDVALVITLDKSYSMHGRKMALAREASQAAFDVLQDTHRFGLVAFDWNPHIVVPLQFARNRDEIAEAISRIEASAQTNFFPALETTFDLLAPAPARVKHVVLVSDGETYPDDYRSLIARFVEAEITVSTVAVGQEADRALLADIADWGGGRSYFLENAEGVQEILIDEAQTTIEDTVLDEAVRPASRHHSPFLAGIAIDEAPPLLGWVRLEAKDSAEIILQTDDGSPLMARWHYGLGQTVVFASDVKNRWAADWLEWPGYGRLWGQVVRGIVRRLGPSLDFRVQRIGDVAQLELRSEDAAVARRQPAFMVEITSPDGAIDILGLEPVAPGRWRGDWRLERAAAAYRFRLVTEATATGAGSPGPDPAWTRLLLYDRADEDLIRPPDLRLLTEISTTTGGSLRPQLDDLFADYGDRASSTTPLWPLFAALALLCYLADLAVRRLSWPASADPRKRATEPDSVIDQGVTTT